VRETLLVSSRLLLLSTLISIISVTLFTKMPKHYHSTINQNETTAQHNRHQYRSNSVDFCLLQNLDQSDALVNYFGPPGVAASKCTAKKYRVIKVKIPYKLDEKIKLKKKKRKIKVHGKISIPIKVPKKILCGKHHG